MVVFQKPMKWKLLIRCRLTKNVGDGLEFVENLGIESLKSSMEFLIEGWSTS